MAWEIDVAHSQASFAIRHMLVSAVRGRFNVLHGHMYIDEQDLAQSWVDAEVDAASVDTHDAHRDEQLRSADFFDTATYPKITFKSTHVEHVCDQEYRVRGDLTLHGVTREVLFDAEYNGRSQDQAGMLRTGLSAKTKINRKDFGLGFKLDAGGVVLSESVTIQIDLEVVQRPVVQETEL